MNTLFSSLDDRPVMSAGLLILFLVATGCASNCPQVNRPEAPAAIATGTDAPKPALDYTKILEGVADINAAVETVRAALAAHGFGVVSDMDIQDTMKKKLGVDMKPYRILGACNPQMALRAIEKEKAMGLLLPCKVIIYENDEGGFTVSFARPMTVFTLVDDPELQSIAEQVDGMIQAAFASL